VLSEILQNESVTAIREALNYMRARLARDAHAANLVPRVESLLLKLNAISASGSTAPPDPALLEQLVQEINGENCAIYGELTCRACRMKLPQSWPGNFFRPIQQAPLLPTPPTPGPRGPNTTEEWLFVARERAQDGSAMMVARPTSAGAVYMMGYGIECSLKGFLRSQSRPFPTSGRAGHNLRALWEVAGFRLSDLNDHNGAKTFYIECWSTDLRYEADLPSSTSPEVLLQAAGELVGWIQKMARRTRRAR